MHLVKVFILVCIIFHAIYVDINCNTCTCLFDLLYCDKDTATEIPIGFLNYNSQYVSQIIS